MNTKAVWPIILALTLSISPMALGASKDKDKTKGKHPKSSEVSKPADRGGAWHGQDWKSGKTVSTTRPSQSVRVVPYQGVNRPGSYISTRPAGEYTYFPTENSYKYDYFAAHYGTSRASAAAVSSRPADVMGYVPPDNAHNPFIYRRPN